MELLRSPVTSADPGSTPGSSTIPRRNIIVHVFADGSLPGRIFETEGLT